MRTPSLSAGLLLPLAIVLLMGSVAAGRAQAVSIPKIPPETAKLDMCIVLCPKPPKSMEEACASLTSMMADPPSQGAGCADPSKMKQEPCVTLSKQFNFICNKNNFYAKPNGFCSTKFVQACHAGRWRLQPPDSWGAEPVKTKSKQACPPNMTPNASRTGCVPKLDTLGGDATPGSVPGAGRAMPGGGATPPRR